jgi:lipoyl(octanoyl) transferase
LKIIDLGLIHYNEASSLQLAAVEEVLAARAAGFGADTLFFCSHKPVVTAGRGTRDGDIFGWSGEVIETSRGGRATYHGPSQIVIYPIFDLSVQRESLVANDLHGYLRILESTVVATLREFGVASEARTIKFEDGAPSLTGVWVGDKKIASIGIAVKKWVTYHGVAINMSEDSNAFQGINPCGFKSEIMTSVEAVTGRPLDDEFIAKFKSTFAHIFTRAF